MMIFGTKNNIRPALLFAIVSMRNVLNVGKKENAFILCVYKYGGTRMNVTLSIPDEIVAKAREYAKRHDTSLNQMVREYLKRFSLEPARQDEAEKAMAFFLSLTPTLPKEVKITRDEMEQR